MTAESTKIHSESQFQYCPLCGEETEYKEVPISSVEIDGEQVITKTNLEVCCPEHGTLYI